MPREVVVSAEPINDAHRMARECAEDAVQMAVKCGQLLAKAKEKLPRGAFDGWVAQNCTFGRTSAYAYMKLADKSSSALDDFGSIRKALGYESKPKPKAAKSQPEPKPAEHGPTDQERRDDSLRAARAAERDERTAVVELKAATAKPEPKPVVVTPPPAFDFTGYDPEDDDDYKSQIEAVFLADDKLAAMREELKQAHREIAALKASRDHYQSQAGEAVRLAKSKEREIEKLRKELAKRAAA